LRKTFWVPYGTIIRYHFAAKCVFLENVQAMPCHASNREERAGASHEDARRVFGKRYQVRANGGRRKGRQVKAQFEKQAFAYRKLAKKRAKDFGLKGPRD
jgi:hypothetical protein